MISKEREMGMQALKLIEGFAEQAPPLSLNLPSNLPFDEWEKIGRKLCAGQQALNWHIGDWWAFGDHRYGDRAKLAAEGIFGREFQTLADMAWVSRKYEPSRRHEVLSFKHHREVASLETDVADDLLGRAEREQWSTRELRREVQSLKAVNDQDAVGDAISAAKPATQPTLGQRDLIEAYSRYVEAMEALQEYRDLSRRESSFLAVALEHLEATNAKRRPCPEDFDVIFVERGRIECEAWYRASRVSVDRWLIERGKRRLIEERAAYLRHQRDLEHPKADTIGSIEPPVDPLLPLAIKAADFLRVSRYGGWIVTQCPGGGWRVGTVQKTSDQLIAMAERQGFDSIDAKTALGAANLHADAE